MCVCMCACMYVYHVKETQIKFCFLQGLPVIYRENYQANYDSTVVTILLVILKRFNTGPLCAFPPGL